MKLLNIIAIALSLLLSVSPAYAYLDTLDALLKDHVKVTRANGIEYNAIDYDAWAKDPRHAKTRDEILATNPQSLSSKNEKLAFWINAYNVLTIDLITREDERDTIKNLGTTFTSPWKKHKWTIADKEYSLDDIEHGIIRKLGEPRIHFAVNCAAKSCPDLRPEAYRPSRLEQQLDEQTRLTFQNSTKGFARIDGQNAVRVTKVMDWFDEDFNDGDLRSWLKPYFPNLINDDTSVKFFSYDWSLNKQLSVE